MRFDVEKLPRWLNLLQDGLAFVFLGANVKHRLTIRLGRFDGSSTPAYRIREL